MQTWLIWRSLGGGGWQGREEDTAGKKGDFRAQRQVSPIWQLARRMEVSMAGCVSPATPQLCSGLVFPSLQWSRGSCLFSCRPRERDSTPTLLGHPFSFIPHVPHHSRIDHEHEIRNIPFCREDRGQESGDEVAVGDDERTQGLLATPVPKHSAYLRATYAVLCTFCMCQLKIALVCLSCGRGSRKTDCGGGGGTKRLVPFCLYFIGRHRLCLTGQ